MTLFRREPRRERLLRRAFEAERRAIREEANAAMAINATYAKAPAARAAALRKLAASYRAEAGAAP